MSLFLYLYLILCVYYVLSAVSMVRFRTPLACIGEYANPGPMISHSARKVTVPYSLSTRHGCFERQKEPWN